MRTAGGLAAFGLVSVFVGGLAAGACTDDPVAAAPPVPDGGDGIDSGAVDTDAADGAGPAKPGDPRRGTRLAPQFRETADGLSDFTRMIDTGLGNVECGPLLAKDGALRCLPDDAAYLGAAAIAYSDAACTTELLVGDAACAKPAFAMRVGEGATCTIGNTVHDVGAQYTAQIYKKTDPSTCVPVASDVKQSYWVVGNERAPSDFVKLTPRTEAIAGGVGVSMADGEDGSSFPQYGLIDIARAKSCHEGKTTDGKTRCIPGNSGYVNGFVDDGCTKPAALVSPYDCDPLFIANTATANTAANDGTEVIFALGAKQPTKQVFRNDTGSCEGPGDVSEDVYERGAEIAPATFPEIAIVKAGGTRITVDRYSGAGTTLPSTIGFRDAMLGVKCAWMRASDGKERCLPQGGVRQFSDDQCTVPVLSTSEAAPKYAIGFGMGCPRPFGVYSVGAEVVPKPTQLYDNSNGCQPGGMPGANTVYAAGAEVPPSTFVEANRVTK